MGFLVRRGVNLGNWLSQSQKRGAERRAFITRQDIQHLAALGFDHVRLPVDEEQLWNEAGQREPEAWELLNACLDWCQESGLKAIADLHILRCHYFNAPQRPLFTDPRAPERFASLWRELAGALRTRSTQQVAYELLNEAVADDPQDWNRVYLFPYRAIRETEPERVIVLGSNAWNQAYTFEFLEVPERDPHLLLTFHYYYPMFLTHFRARYVKECAAYQGPVQYPGLPIPQAEFNRLPGDIQKLASRWNKHHDRQVMAADLLWPLAVSARTRLPLYCGEFGVIQCAPAEPRAAWNRDFLEVLEAHGIGWANWSYKTGFGMFEPDGQPQPELRAWMNRPPNSKGVTGAGVG